MAVCSFIKPDGTACKAQPMRGDSWCYVHHSQYAEKCRRDGVKGGKRGGRGRLSPPTLEIAAIKADLKEIVSDVRQGRLQTSRGNTIASLLHVYLRCIEADLKCIEVELAIQERLELVTRLEELEQQLQDKKEYGA
jgi:hypothetical protein